MTSLENAALVHEERHASDPFAPKGTQLELLAAAQRLQGHLQRDEAAACTIETIGGRRERTFSLSCGFCASTRRPSKGRHDRQDGTLLCQQRRRGDYTPRQGLDIVRARTARSRTASTSPESPRPCPP